MVEILARRIPAETLLNKNIHQPGDFQYQNLGYEPTDDPLKIMKEDQSCRDHVARFAFICPRTGELCLDGSGLIIGYKEKPDFSPTWSWDGNVEHPTLNPSINCGFSGKCRWHGYVTNGKFTKV